MFYIAGFGVDIIQDYVDRKRELFIDACFPNEFQIFQMLSWKVMQLAALFLYDRWNQLWSFGNQRDRSEIKL